MKEITVKELKAKLDNNEDFQLIDVREEYEHEESNIGGELMPMQTVLNHIDTISREKQVVLYCRSGGRSGAVIKELEIRHGFENLYNLRGGILAYSSEIDGSI